MHAAPCHNGHWTLVTAPASVGLYRPCSIPDEHQHSVLRQPSCQQRHDTPFNILAASHAFIANLYTTPARLSLQVAAMLSLGKLTALSEQLSLQCSPAVQACLLNWPPVPDPVNVSVCSTDMELDSAQTQQQAPEIFGDLRESSANNNPDPHMAAPPTQDPLLVAAVQVCGTAVCQIASASQYALTMHSV